MVNKSDIIYNEARNNLRVKESRSVLWRVNDGDIKGKGQIRNISTTGMLLETNSNFVPTEGCRFSFDSALGHDNFIPQNGKLVWHKRKPFSKNKYLCGIRFVEPGEYVLTKLRQRVQKGIKHIANARRMRKVVNFMMIIGMIAMTAYVLWEASHVYQNMNTTNRRMLDASQQQALLTQSFSSRLDVSEMQLASVTEELDATRTLYRESQGLLGEVRVELELTKAVLADTESLLEQTKTDLVGVQGELSTTQSDLAARTKELEGVKEELLGAQTNLAGVSAGRDELAAKIKALEESNTGAKADFENTIQLLELKNLQLNEEMAKLQQKITDITAANVAAATTSGTVESRNIALTQEIETLKSQLAAVSESQTVGADQKIIQLNEQIDSLKAQLVTANNQNANLKEVRIDNQKLNDDIIRLKKMLLAVSESKVAGAEAKMAELNTEIDGLKGELAALSADNVLTKEQGQNLIKTYRQEMAKVKDKLKHFRAEAKKVREDALIERDRIQMSLGNQGYFMKNGKAVQVDYAKYENVGLNEVRQNQEIEAVAINVPEVGATSATPAVEPTPASVDKPIDNRQFEIDVTFVE